MLELSGKRIVLTADRSLMTNYRGNFLYGFIACGPYEVLPEWVFDKVFCPAVETDPVTGEAKVAQVGLRRVESALHQGYDKRCFRCKSRTLSKINRSRYQSCRN